MNMNNKKLFGFNLKVAIAVAAVSLLFLSAWRDIRIYYAYQNGNTKTVTSECISVSVDRTNEPRRYSFFTIFSFYLKCGTTVAVYEDTANQLLHTDNISEQLQELERQFVTGRPVTITYVSGMTVVDDTYALIDASDCGGLLIDASLGIAHYSERVKTIVTLDCILYSISFVSLISPLIPYINRKWRHRKNRIRKKRRKQNAQQQHKQRKKL